MATLIIHFAKLLFSLQPSVMSLVSFIWCSSPLCQSYPQNEIFSIPVREGKSTFFCCPSARTPKHSVVKVYMKAWHFVTPFLKVAKLVLAYVFQGINWENLEPPPRKFIPCQLESADLEMSNSMNTCYWVGSPLLGCKESHLPCLKAEKRISVPYQMPDSLKDWGF